MTTLYLKDASVAADITTTFETARGSKHVPCALGATN